MLTSRYHGGPWAGLVRNVTDFDSTNFAVPPKTTTLASADALLQNDRGHYELLSYAHNGLGVSAVYMWRSTGDTKAVPKVLA